MKPRARLVAVFILLQTILFLPALQTPVFAKGETFPAGHWSYDIIENLVVRGHLSELYDAAKPYTRYDVAKAIYNSDKSRIKDITTLWLFIKLEEELANELSWVELSSMPGTALRLGVRLSEIAQKDAETSFSPKFRGRSRMALYYGEHFILYNSTVIQQQGAYDIVSRTRPFGKTTGYTEQAYVGFEKDALKIKLGRDYLEWGYGRNSMVVNNEAGSFDQVFIQLQSNTVRFTYTTAILDQVVFNQENKEGIGIISDHFDRYFTAERLDFNLLNSMLRFGIWQAVIYGGKNQPLNLRYANPFTIYKSNAKTPEDNTNAIFGTDMSLYVGDGLNVYGSLMFNDWSEFSEDSAKVDLNKWGGILGFRASDILKSFNIYGTDAFVEINKLSLGAYDQPGAFKEYRFLFADNPIGHPIGSDFEKFELGLSHWFYRSLRVDMNLKMLSVGEASITNRSSALSDTDSPSGTPQKTTMLQFGAFYQPFNEFNSELSFANVWTSNAGNVKGRSETDFQVFLRVMIELQPFFQL